MDFERVSIMMSEASIFPLLVTLFDATLRYLILKGYTLVITANFAARVARPRCLQTLAAASPACSLNNPVC